MKSFSRRDMLKTSLLAPAAAVAAHGMGPVSAAMQAAGEEPASHAVDVPRESANPGAGREKLLLDFGWRFHLGDANDPAKDFGFGGGRAGNFQKTGNFLPAGTLAFDDNDWRQVDESASSLMAHTAKRWWSSTGSISGATAAATIRSALT